MAILVRCNQCQYEGTVPDELDGAQITCPQCEEPCQISAERERIRAIASPAGTKVCPFCGEEIQSIARKCKHCDEFLDEELLYLMELSDTFNMGSLRKQLEVQQTKEKLQNAEILGGLALFLSFVPGFVHLHLNLGADGSPLQIMMSLLYLLVYSGSTAGVFLLSVGASREYEQETEETIDIRPPIFLGLVALVIGLLLLGYLRVAGVPLFRL